VELLLDRRMPVFADWTATEVAALSPLAKYHVPAVRVVSVRLLGPSRKELEAGIRAYAAGTAKVVAGFDRTFGYEVGAVVTPRGRYSDGRRIGVDCGAGIHLFFSKEGAYAYSNAATTWFETPAMYAPGTQEVTRLLAGEEHAPPAGDAAPPLTDAAVSRVIACGAGSA